MCVVETAEGEVRREVAAHGCFAWLERRLETYRVRDEAAAAALPFDFWGGYVGYLGCVRWSRSLRKQHIEGTTGQKKGLFKQHI